MFQALGWMSLFISPEAAPARVGKSQTKEIQERYRTYRLRTMYIPREMENISRGPTFGDFVISSRQDVTVARLQSLSEDSQNIPYSIVKRR
jgi:hypothetical protein